MVLCIDSRAENDVISQLCRCFGLKNRLLINPLRLHSSIAVIIPSPQENPRPEIATSHPPRLLRFRPHSLALISAWCLDCA